ncbi:MSN4 [Candida margitis]|uniref:MSN4 n=1 Tax=Candida margitis TaxID=1775924 RepID=UPI00222675EF|nr:MSN4 [Candida margitis]KAI5969276.1 MSN4 [Candida margitis]
MSSDYQSLFGNYTNHSNLNRTFATKVTSGFMDKDAHAEGVKMDGLGALDSATTLACGDELPSKVVTSGLDPKQKESPTSHLNSALSSTSNDSTVTNLSDTFQLNDETFFKSSYLATPANFKGEVHLQPSDYSNDTEFDTKMQSSKLSNTSSIDTELPLHEDYHYHKNAHNNKQPRHNSAPSYMQHHQFLNDIAFGTTATNGLNYKHSYQEEIASNVSTNSLNQYFATPNSSISSASSSSSTSNAFAAGSASDFNKQITGGNVDSSGANLPKTPILSQDPLHTTTRVRQHSSTIPIDQLTSLTLRTPSTSSQSGPSRKRSLSSIDKAQKQQQQQHQLVNLLPSDFNQQMKVENGLPFSTDPASSLINLDANTIAFSAATAAAVCADSVGDFYTTSSGYENKGSFDQQQGTINPRQLFTTGLTTSFSSPSLSSVFGLKKSSNLQHHQPQNSVPPPQQHLTESPMSQNMLQDMPPMNQLEPLAFPSLHNRSLSTPQVDFRTNGDPQRAGDLFGNSSDNNGVNLVSADLDISESLKPTYVNRNNGLSNGSIGKNRSYSYTNGMHSSKGHTRRNSLQTVSKGKQFAGASPQQQSHFAQAVSQQLDELKEQQQSGKGKQQSYIGQVASLQLSPATEPATFDKIKEDETVSIAQPTQQMKKRRKSSVTKSSVQAQQLLIKEQLDKSLEGHQEQVLQNNKSTSKSVSPTNSNQLDPKVTKHSDGKSNRKGGGVVAKAKNSTNDSTNLQNLDPKGLLTAPVVQNENGCFPCSECDKQFKRTEHLKRHIRSVHSNIRPYHCHYCERKFSRSDNLAQHIKTHYKIDGSGNTNIVYGDVSNLNRRDKKKKKKNLGAI